MNFSICRLSIGLYLLICINVNYISSCPLKKQSSYIGKIKGIKRAHDGGVAPAKAKEDLKPINSIDDLNRSRIVLIVCSILCKLTYVRILLSN